MDYKEITSRIDELNLDGYKHIKNNNWGIPDDLTDWLTEKGFELIGEGWFSDVFQSPTENFIVKVNNKEEFDQAYLKFVEYCQNNKQNPHLPKMGKIKTFDLQDGEDDYESKWFVIFIEKLQPYTEDLFGFSDKKDNTSEIFNILVNQKYNTENLITSFFNKHSDWNINPTKSQMKQIIDCTNTLIALKEKLNIKKNFDLHTGNIMQRNGIAVITDPLT